MKRLAPLVAAGLLLAGLAPAGLSHAAAKAHAATTMPNTVTVLVGLGQFGVSQGSQLAYTPKYTDISVGDTVVFKEIDQLEPHTVTFGSMAALKKMSDNLFVPTPQKNGPPLLVLDPKGITPTAGHTYNGMGIANSGIIPFGKSWRLTFTAPGTFHYICLIHGTHMAGAVTVHQAQPSGPMWIVQAGDGMAAQNDTANSTVNDSFYPRHLTIKVGDTVEWIGGFHTITFGPDAMRTQLEKNLFVPVAQKSGPPILVFNPKVAFPSGGSTYNGTGFVNSGILVFTVPQGSKAPPSFKLKFTAPGTFEYDCLLHPGMDGTITVAQ